MIRQIGVVLVCVMVLGCAAKQKITAESLCVNPPSGGYTKVYSVSFDEAYQAVLDVCDDLDLVVEREDKEHKAVVLWGDMDKKIDEELIGVYFDAYHENRTAIRIITPSMKYKPNSWDEFDKADPWGLKIHTALKKKIS